MGKGAGHHKSWRWLLGGLFFFRSQPLTRPLGQPCVRRTGREMEAAEQEKKKKNVARVLFLVSAVFSRCCVFRWLAPREEVKNRMTPIPPSTAFRQRTSARRRTVTNSSAARTSSFGVRLFGSLVSAQCRGD